MSLSVWFRSKHWGLVHPQWTGRCCRALAEDSLLLQEAHPVSHTGRLGYRRIEHVLGTCGQWQQCGCHVRGTMLLGSNTPGKQAEAPSGTREDARAQDPPRAPGESHSSAASSPSSQGAGRDPSAIPLSLAATLTGWPQEQFVRVTLSRWGCWKHTEWGQIKPERHLQMSTERGDGVFCPAPVSSRRDSDSSSVPGLGVCRALGSSLAPSPCSGGRQVTPFAGK